MITQSQKDKFFTILHTCKVRRLKICPQNELPEYLDRSLSTIKAFENGKVFDWFLLEDYAAFTGYHIYVDLIEKTR